MKIFQMRELFGKCITHKDDGRPMLVYPAGRVIFDEPLADTRLMTVPTNSLNGSVEDYQVLPESRCQKAFAWHKTYARYMRTQDAQIDRMERDAWEDKLNGWKSENPETEAGIIDQYKKEMLRAIERLNDE